MKRTILIAAGLFAITLSSPVLAADDVAHGKTLFARCAICHKVEKGAAHGLGPNLFGVFGKKAAAQTGFMYSGPLKNAKLTWTKVNLDKWLVGPARMVPGTKMAFPGMSSKKDRADLVAYLATLK